MKSINIHEIIINRNNLHIISADAAFYAFMGERLYVPFEKFISEEDKKTLSEIPRMYRRTIYDAPDW